MFETNEEQKKKFKYILKAILMILLILAAVKFIANPNRETFRDSISFSGYGEVSAVPDIASVNFSIIQEAKTVKEAQSKVAEIEAGVLDLLKEYKIEDRDIKTESISFNPKYEYRYSARACPVGTYCPPGGKNVLVGYEAHENISLKIRNTDDVGGIVEGIGALDVTNLNGPNFTIDDEDALKEQARQKAIENAKEKAKSLSADLGIRLGKISSFYEQEDSVMPMYYKGAGMMDEMATSAVSEPSIRLPKGENTISSNVVITYWIK